MPEDTGTTAGGPRSAAWRAALHETVTNARGRRRDGDYYVEYDQANACWSVLYTFGRQPFVFCYCPGNSFDRGDDDDQGKLDAEAIVAALEAVPRLCDALDVAEAAR